MTRFLQWLLRLALMLVINLLASGVFAQSNHIAELEDYFEKARQDWGVPGMAIAIVQGDSLIFARGYGLRELGKAGEVDERTLFAVASNTKAFTAALLGMLVEENKLQWDDRVADHIKNFQMYDFYVTRELNVIDLLTHRSGLPTFGGDHLWIGSSLSRAQIIERLRYLKPTASLRTTFQYQNLMYTVAGELIPAITGKSWEEAMRERILTPLGMAASTLTIRDLVGRDNVAMPHEVVDGKLVPIAYDSADAVAPAGALNSNVVEMTRWMRLNLNGGAHNGTALLSPMTLKEMQRIHFPQNVSPFEEANLHTRFRGYGLGWGISEYKGFKLVQHSGGLSGMISLQTLLPEQRLGVIVLTNRAPTSLPWPITYRILDHFLGEPERDWSALYLELQQENEARRRQHEQTLQEARVKGTKPSLALQRYTGLYHDDLSGNAAVLLRNGKLYYNYNPRHHGELEHWHYDTFRVHWQHQIFDMADKTFLQFMLDETGKVAGLEVTFYDPIYFERVK